MTAAQLLTLYPTREAKIARIKEIERKLSRMEAEDEGNDPVLIQGHISLKRGFRMGCGVFLICFALMCVQVMGSDVRGEHGWVKIPLFLSVLGAVVMILRGWLYRPDVELIHESYQPHRKTPEFRELIDHMEKLARALSQDLQPEDEL